MYFKVGDNSDLFPNYPAKLREMGMTLWHDLKGEGWILCPCSATPSFKTAVLNHYSLSAMRLLLKKYIEGK
jgi:hypothetical protein